MGEPSRGYRETLSRFKQKCPLQDPSLTSDQEQWGQTGCLHTAGANSVLPTHSWPGASRGLRFKVGSHSVSLALAGSLKPPALLD